MKGPVDDGPKWHYPNNDEIAFANHLLSLHLQSPLACLRSICNENRQANSSGTAFYVQIGAI
jgi:proteasome activator subunit 4